MKFSFSFGSKVICTCSGNKTWILPSSNKDIANKDMANKDTAKKKKKIQNFEVAYHIQRYSYAQTRFTRTGIGGRAILKK